MDWIVQIDLQHIDNTDQYRIVAFEQDRFDGESSYWELHPKTADVDHLMNELNNMLNFKGPGIYTVDVKNQYI